MIPKKIHYCWFGRGELPPLAKKCIASWKKYCPDYEILEWNEDNFDSSKYPFATYCLKNKMYAFLSDYVRLQAVEENGGFYFDTDVELVANIDNLLSQGAVYCFENNQAVNTGQGFGATAHHETVKALIEIYDKLKPNDNGEYEINACPNYNTEALMKFGLVLNGITQKLGDTLVLSQDYMNPFDNATGVLTKTENTLSIHWYNKSWLTKGQILRSKITRPIHRIFGNECFNWLKK